TSCGRAPAALVGLPCSTKVAKQPEAKGLPELLVKRYTAYTSLDEPAEVIESPGGGSSNQRKTFTTYDSAGRVITTRQEGGGKELPPTKTIYSETTGRPVEQRFVCESKCEGFAYRATRTKYDTLGRAVEYEDADGNIAKTKYDPFGRPVLAEDAKG